VRNFDDSQPSIAVLDLPYTAAFHSVQKVKIIFTAEALRAVMGQLAVSSWQSAVVKSPYC
jgi:hypothetical protein